MLVVLEVAASVVDVVDCSDVVVEPLFEASVDDVPAAVVVDVELELASSGATTVTALEHPDRQRGDDGSDTSPSSPCRRLR